MTLTMDCNINVDTEIPDLVDGDTFISPAVTPLNIPKYQRAVTEDLGHVRINRFAVL